MGRFHVSAPAQCSSDEQVTQPTLNTKTANSPISHLPDPVAFFSFVKPDGYPEQEMATAEKAQPWKSIFEGPVPPKDGKLLIACPKGCDWGSGSGLGGY